MRFYWLRDRMDQGHFALYWMPGSANLADYFTKHFNTKTHMAKRHVYLKCNHVFTQQESFFRSARVC